MPPSVGPRAGTTRSARLKTYSNVPRAPGTPRDSAALTDRQVSMMAQGMLDMFDKDKSGSISKKEFRRVLMALGLEHMPASHFDCLFDFE